MGHIRCRALRTSAELRQLQRAVVSTPHTLAAFRRFTFRNAHNLKSLMLKLKFVQLSPSGRTRFVRIGTAGFFRLANGRFRQAPAFGVTQRMLRKLKENIFPHIGRQVHDIVNYGRRFLALERQMEGPGRQIQARFEGFEASDTLAVQGKM